MDIKELEDRIALKELIDNVSILGDRKDFNKQVELFTENAVSETFAGGIAILKLEGRKPMADAFGEFLKDFETVYHFNGQQLIELDGDKATGTVYCFITLIENEGDKKIKTTIGAIYEDTYIRTNSRWLIASRIGNFAWQDKSEVKN